MQEVRHEWDRVRRPSRPAGPGRPRRAEGGEVRVKMEDGGEGECSRSPRLSDEANDEPQFNSPTLSSDNEQTIERKNKEGCGETSNKAPRVLIKSGSAPSGLNFMSRMPLEFSEKREAAFSSGGGKKMLPPSPALKRLRENDDMFSPSIYPRLTALKLISPCNTPKPAPSQLAGNFHKYECSPLLNRSPSHGPAAAEQDNSLDPSLLLPPLALSLPALSEPAGGMEENSAAHSRGSLAAEVTRKLFRGGPMTPAQVLPSHVYIELPRGCQALSALEFLATAAAAQRVSSI